MKTYLILIMISFFTIRAFAQSYQVLKPYPGEEINDVITLNNSNPGNPVYVSESNPSLWRSRVIVENDTTNSYVEINNAT